MLISVWGTLLVTWPLLTGHAALIPLVAAPLLQHVPRRRLMRSLRRQHTWLPNVRNAARFAAEAPALWTRFLAQWTAASRRASRGMLLFVDAPMTEAESEPELRLA